MSTTTASPYEVETTNEFTVTAPLPDGMGIFAPNTEAWKPRRFEVTSAKVAGARDAQKKKANK